MGKNVIYTYSCDDCEKNFNTPDEVLSLHGDIKNGEDKIFIDSVVEKDKIFCKNCFINKILGQDKKTCNTNTKQEIVKKEVKIKPVVDFVVLRKIETIEDENVFIEYLGHLSRENFAQIYKKSLIGCYYPIEDSIDFNVYDSECEIDVIYKAFAGVPQIKKVMAFLTNQSFAYTDKNNLTDN